jgi:hypothetical protein
MGEIFHQRETAPSGHGADLDRFEALFAFDQLAQDDELLAAGDEFLLDQKFFGFGEGLLRVGGKIEVEGVGIPIQRLVALSRSRTGKPCLEICDSSLKSSLPIKLRGSTFGTVGCSGPDAE